MVSRRVVRGRANPLYFKFRLRLRKARQAATLTGSALARAAGLDRGMVSYLERGEGTPKIGTAERLADALRVSPGELAYGLPSPWEPAPELRCASFAGRLRRVRQDLGLSLREVGRRAGSSAAAIRSLEAGTQPTIAVVEDVAKALGVSPGWLAYNIGPRELPRQKEKPAETIPAGRE